MPSNKTKIRGFGALLLLALGLSQCQPPQPVPPPDMQGMPEDFLAFYQRFLSDSAYQMAHIEFPLQGLPMGADSVTQTFYWEKSTWRIHRDWTKADSTVHFERHFESPLPNIVTEVVQQKNTPLGIIRRFYKRDTAWLLIYYADMNVVVPQ